MIPLFSAVAANKDLNLLASVQRVIERHWYVLGEEVAEFEKEFAQYIGVTNCISVANGTDALELALRGVGVRQGDKVITVANAGFYSSTAIHAVGAVPCYVDVDANSLTMCLAAFEAALALKPKAVIVTHLYGRLAEIESIARLAKAGKVAVVEDCAQAHGAAQNDRKAGSFGDVACFSFYPTKNLGALGDGGAVVTRSTEVAEQIRMLRQYGWSQKYKVAVPGGRNSRLDEMQAAVLRTKLPYLDGWNEQRREIAKRYNQAFSGFPLQCPQFTGKEYVAHLYVVQIENRDAFRNFLKENAILTDVHYPIPDHKQAAYALPAESNGKLEKTEQACEKVVSLPCYPGMTDEEVEQVITVVRMYFNK